MDPKNKLAPLFQAQLELLEPDMVFSPSLDPSDKKGFKAIVKSLIDDILKMASLVERIDPKQECSYEDQILCNDDIAEMKDEILNGIDKVSIYSIKLCNRCLNKFSNVNILNCIF